MNQRPLSFLVPESGVPLISRGKLPFCIGSGLHIKRVSTLQKNKSSANILTKCKGNISFIKFTTSHGIVLLSYALIKKDSTVISKI